MFYFLLVGNLKQVGQIQTQYHCMRTLEMRAGRRGKDITEAIAVAGFELEATGFLAASVEA